MNPRRVAHAFLLSFWLAANSPSQEWTLSVTLDPEHEGLSIPLEVPWPVEGGPEPQTSWKLLGEGEDFEAPLQMNPSRGTFLLNLPPRPAGRHVLRLVPDRSPSVPFAFVETEGGKLELREEGRPVLAYAHGRQLAEGVPEDRAREGYVHPIHDLDGTVLTDDFPADHFHHRGLSWMWPRVRLPEGEVLDLWTLRGLAPRFSRFAVRETGPAAAVLVAEGTWRHGSRPVVEERVTLRAWRAFEGGRLVDLELELRSVEGTITLMGEPTKGYGGMGFRVGPRRAGSIVTPLGREPGDRLHVTHPWADYSGRFGEGEGVSGIALFVHPGNDEHPVEWLLRYYGYVGECWPGMARAELSEERWTRRSYRLFVHRGRAEEARVAAHYRAYAQPPRTTWSRQPR